MPKLVQTAPEFSTQEMASSHPPAESRPPGRGLWLGLIVAGAVLLVVLIIFGRSWPFTQHQVVADLEEALQGQVKIGKFHETFFPHPGCVAEDVTLTSYGKLPNPNPITIRKLTIQGSYHGLLTKHVPLLQAEGVHVTAPNASYLSGWQENSNHSKAIIDQFVATGSVIEFSQGTQPGLKFEISEWSIRAPDVHGVMQFKATLENPEPPGDVQLSGYLGPWRTDNTAQTPISGSYSFTHANLGAFHGIAGILSSQGSFQGKVGELSVRGKTSASDFEVTEAGHKMPLTTQFQATVNTKSGDVSLQTVTALLGKSDVESAGSIAQNESAKPKVTSLGLLVRNGRIQDFLFLFLDDRTAPMTGLFNFKGRTILPGDKAPFIEKVQLEGDFGVNAAQVSNPATQANLAQLSKRAEGENPDKEDPPERVVSDLTGHVVLNRGTATFSNLRFKVPGAVARLQGTYSLITHRINLRGTVYTQAQLPKTTTGVKSFLLKIVNPFLKKNHHGGGVVPITITGIYPNPVYKTDPI